MLEFLANLVRFVGLAMTVAGLWYSAGGLRMVVSGRIDERRKSAESLKKGLPLLAAGLLLLFGGTWLITLGTIVMSDFIPVAKTSEVPDPGTLLGRGRRTACRADPRGRALVRAG